MYKYLLICLSCLVISFISEAKTEKAASAETTHKPSNAKLVNNASNVIPIIPPKTHPRVLLNSDFIKTLKKRFASLPLYKLALNRIKKIAHRENAGALAGDKFYNKSIALEMRCQAFLYAVQGAGKDGAKAVKNILNFLENGTFRERHDVTRDYGEMIYTAAIIYDWCHPLLTTADKEVIISGMIRYAKHMEIGWPPVKQSSIVSHAGEAQLFRDLLSAGIAVYNHKPQLYEYSAQRFFAEMVPAREFFFKSHRHHQGIFYGSYRFSWAEFAAVLFKRMSGKLVFSENMGKVPYFWIYAKLPNGRYLCDGDGDRTIPQLWHMGVSSLYRDPFVKQESLNAGANKLAKSKPLKFVLFNDPTVKTKPFSELPWTKYFPEPLGSMIVRTGWQQGPDSSVAVVEMKGAGYVFANHQHVDAGTFQIYYKGFLATDGGAYKDYGSPFDWSYNKRTIAHNGMLAYDPDETYTYGDNDGGQRQLQEPKNLDELLDKGYRNGSIMAHSFGPNKQRPYFNLLKVDLKEAYKLGKLSNYTRTFCFLNFADPNRPGALIVLDRMTCTKPETKKYWLLQSQFKPIVKDNTVTISRTDKINSGKMVDTVLLPEQDNIKFEIIGGAGKESWVFCRNYQSPVTGGLCHGWRTQISPLKSSKSDVFLNVMQIMDAKLEKITVRKFSTSKLLGIALNKRIVTFPVDGIEIKNEFELEIPETGQDIQILLTGLGPGNWNISDRFSCNVKAEAGTAFFTIDGPAVLRISPITHTSLPELKLDIAPPKEVLSGTRLLVNGKSIKLEQILHKNRTSWLPAETVLKTLGAKTEFKNDVLTASYNGRTLKTCKAKNKVFVNGARIYLPLAPPIINGKLYLPVATLASFVKMIPRIEKQADCVVFSSYPSRRSNYPWYEQIRSSGSHPDFPVINACDGHIDTYWAVSGKGSYITVDLGEKRAISGVRIAWYAGQKRKAIFTISVSNDRKNWQTVYDGKSSGKTDGFETYTFKPCKARFFKLTGLGNSLNNYTSIYELEVIAK